MRTSAVAACLSGLIPLLSACTHTFELKDADRYRLSLSHGPRQDIAILASEGTGDATSYHELVVEGLRRHPSVNLLRTNWSWNRREPGFRPDVVLEVKPRAEYSGSGWNYPITFPGFLLFAHAWHGFVYNAHLTTEVNLYNPSDRKLIETKTIETEYSMRHCDFGRGFWASIGWWTPGYGAASALTALYMITYDDDATEPFQEKVARPYGDYIAESILRPVLARLGDRPHPSSLVADDVEP